MSRDRSCLGPKIPSMYGKGVCTILCAKPNPLGLRTNYAGWTRTNYAGSRTLNAFFESLALAPNFEGFLSKSGAAIHKN